ncbi:MAG: KamA family radical SAM protein [Bacteriovoracaceae bacterium]|jgi:lysine 2,3-aminomutase|nr:KamA family radical SAM protein [Bacteriovoracaceae bacterium]
MKWQKKISSSYRTSKDINSFNLFQVSDIDHYAMKIPKDFYEHLLKSKSSKRVLYQFLPTKLEEVNEGFNDPIGDEINAKGHGIIHRYENRVLFSPTVVCPINCRYCFRKNELHADLDFFKSSTQKLIKYLKEHPFVNEVILTGGDPFSLSNEKIKNLLNEISKVSTVEFLRFHTRFPIVLPDRFEDELIHILSSFQKRFFLKVMIHVNHIDEFSKKAIQVIDTLKENKIELLSQSVLLKGVNDTTKELYELYIFLARIEVKAYYLHHPDQVKGAMHFYLSKEDGLSLFEPLRKRLSGWMLPTYIFDAPSGRGKKVLSKYS